MNKVKCQFLFDQNGFPFTELRDKILVPRTGEVVTIGFSKGRVVKVEHTKSFGDDVIKIVLEAC